MNATTILLAGVGGQGTILAADLLAHAASAAGLDVKVSEIHGMAQRGGSVSTVVRFGEAVESMVTDLGCADCIISFETTEALRNLPFLREGGFLLVNDETIKPLTVLTGKAGMPANVYKRLDDLEALVIPATQLAIDAGNAKASNVVLLGALSNKLSFPVDAWTDTIANRVPPKTIECNLAAFEAGRAYAR